MKVIQVKAIKAIGLILIAVISAALFYVLNLGTQTEPAGSVSPTTHGKPQGLIEVSPTTLKKNKTASDPSSH